VKVIRIASRRVRQGLEARRLERLATELLDGPLGFDRATINEAARLRERARQIRAALLDPEVLP
jgi:hypothetical protein